MSYMTVQHFTCVFDFSHVKETLLSDTRVGTNVACRIFTIAIGLLNDRLVNTTKVSIEHD